MAIIQVQSPLFRGGGNMLTLAEAIEVANGENPEAVRRCRDAISGDPAADEEIEIRLVCREEELVLPGSETLSSALPPLRTEKRVVIDGQGKRLRGGGTGCGLILSSGRAAVRRLAFSNFSAGIFLTQAERSMDDIVIEECGFDEMTHACILGGMTGSNLTLSRVVVRRCDMQAPPRSRKRGACTAVLLSAVLDWTGGVFVSGTAMRDLLICGNVIRAHPDGGTFSEGINLFTTCDYTYGVGGPVGAGGSSRIEDCITEDVLIEENDISGVDDTCIGFLGALPARERCSIRNFTVRRNRAAYFLTGLCVSSCNQYAGGESYHCTADGIYMEDNVLLPSAEAPDEPSMAIALINVRAESGKIVCEDCVLENVAVRRNHIEGRDWGIVLEGMHGTQDLPAPSRLLRCGIRDVTIERNEIRGVREPLRMYGVRLEGRTDRFWDYGVVEVNDQYPYSVYAEGNYIDRITVRDNEASDYDCFLNMAGAWAAGRGFARNNSVGPELVFENNSLDKGKKVFAYRYEAADQRLLEEACGFGNRAWKESVSIP